VSETVEIRIDNCQEWRRPEDTTVEVDWPFAVSEYYAARSMCGERRSIGTGMTLDLSSLLMSRIRWLLTSLMRA
jgi:hypothetical protein